MSVINSSEARSTTGVISRPNSLAEDVYDAIFAQLMALNIAPGSRITVDNLVKEFNVSHTPIREALGRLEGEGLVVKTHLVGYHAAPQITRRRFDELYELRLLLEPQSAAKAAAMMDDARLAELQDAAGVMARRDDNDERSRYSNFARRDAVFHDKIMRCAQNELIRQTLAFQHTHFHIFRTHVPFACDRRGARRARRHYCGIRGRRFDGGREGDAHAYRALSRSSSSGLRVRRSGCQR